jgi:hypothetical protein
MGRNHQGARDELLQFVLTSSQVLLDFGASFLVKVPPLTTGGRSTTSFCAGQITLSMHGHMDGFCVTTSYAVDNVRVLVEDMGTLLVSKDLPPSSGYWYQTEIVLANHSLLIRLDGRDVLRDVKLRSWNPTEPIALSFSARSATLSDEHDWFDAVRISPGSGVTSSMFPVEISLDGQQFSSDGITFTYLREANLRTISPQSGPSEGGTLVALSVKAPSSDFARAHNFACLFGNTTVNGTWAPSDELVRCQTPASSIGTGRVAVQATGTIDGKRLTVGDAVVFTYFTPPQLYRVLPNAGPVAGHTVILIFGLGFAAGLGPFACRFETDIMPATMELERDLLRCATPPSPARMAAVAVTLNGQQYHEGVHSATFRSYLQPHVLSVSPASGTIHGQTLVTVSGSFTVASKANLCRWGSQTTNATSINETHIVCPSPRTDAGSRALEVTMNGQQYTADGIDFSFYLHPRVHKLSVSGRQGELGTWTSDKITVPQRGFILVRVWGSGFLAARTTVAVSTIMGRSRLPTRKAWTVSCAGQTCGRGPRTRMVRGPIWSR